MEHTVWLIPEHIAEEIRKIYSEIEATGNLSTRIFPPMLILPPHVERDAIATDSSVTYSFGKPEIRENRLFLPIEPNPFSPTGMYSAGVYLCTEPSEETLLALEGYLTKNPLGGSIKQIKPKHRLFTESPTPWDIPQRYEIYHYHGDPRKTEKPVDLH